MTSTYGIRLRISRPSTAKFMIDHFAVRKPWSSTYATRPCTIYLSIVTIADVPCVIAPILVEERSHELRTVSGEVEEILDTKQRARLRGGPSYSHKKLSIRGDVRSRSGALTQRRTAAGSRTEWLQSGVQRGCQCGLSHVASRLQFVARVQES